MAKTASFTLADSITEDILSGAFPPGMRLDEAGLAAKYNLSRTPVREALSEVCARGLARREPYRGVEVIRPDPAVLLDKFEALAEIEALCAEFAACRGRIDQVLQLENLAAQMDQADMTQYQHLNLKFHALIADMAGNTQLIEMAQALSLSLQVLRHAQLSRVERREQSKAEHRALVRAIANRDAPQARELMRHHFRRAAAESLALLTEKPSVL